MRVSATRRASLVVESFYVVVFEISRCEEKTLADSSQIVISEV